MWSSLGTKKMPGINNLVTMGITGLPLLKGPTSSFSSFAPFPAKTFANPNFVNKNHPRRHNSQNSFPEPSNYSEDDEKVTGKQDDRQETVPEETEQKKMSNTKKRRKKRSRKGKKKEHGPTVRQLCKQSMEVDISEEENVDSGEETEIPSIHSRTIDIMSLVPEKKVAVAVSYTSTESVMPQQLFRSRVPSLCESEDSFIVFDDNIEDDTDSDENLQSGSDVEESSDTAIDLPIKKVRFSKDLKEVHHMVQWAFAYQAARRGPWEEYARDRERFKKRIAETEKSLKWVLQPSHRTKIYTERFD